MEQLGVAQEEFLGNVAKALGREKFLSNPPSRKDIGPPAFWQEDEKIKEQALELFKNNLEALSGRVFVTKDKDEVNDKVNEWLMELQAENIVCWKHEDLEKILNPHSLHAKIVYWDPKQKSAQELIALAAKADVGITWVNYAIAYTGTMAVFSSPTTGRNVSLLPPTHIAIFKREQLVPTMSHVMRNLTELKGADNLPSAVNFITGPSRTSDIEMDLSIGVHGPYRTWVIVLDE